MILSFPIPVVSASAVNNQPIQCVMNIDELVALPRLQADNILKHKENIRKVMFTIRAPTGVAKNAVFESNDSGTFFQTQQIKFFTKSHVGEWKVVNIYVSDCDGYGFGMLPEDIPTDMFITVNA